LGNKLNKLQEQLAKINSEIEAEKRRLKEADARELKQKIRIIGRFVFDRAVKDGTLDDLVREMDQADHLKKAVDRKLFGLSENGHGHSQAEPTKINENNQENQSTETAAIA
jgi:hypothetical protein